MNLVRKCTVVSVMREIKLLTEDYELWGAAKIWQWKIICLFLFINEESYCRVYEVLLWKCSGFVPWKNVDIFLSWGCVVTSGDYFNSSLWPPSAVGRKFVLFIMWMSKELLRLFLRASYKVSEKQKLKTSTLIPRFCYASRAGSVGWTEL